jgi:hypothetical protein
MPSFVTGYNYRPDRRRVVVAEASANINNTWYAKRSSCAWLDEPVLNVNNLYLAIQRNPCKYELLEIS